MDSTLRSRRHRALPPLLLATLGRRRRLATAAVATPRVATAAAAFADRIGRLGHGVWSRWSHPATPWPAWRHRLVFAAAGLAAARPGEPGPAAAATGGDRGAVRRGRREVPGDTGIAAPDGALPPSALITVAPVRGRLRRLTPTGGESAERETPRRHGSAFTPRTAGAPEVPARRPHQPAPWPPGPALRLQAGTPLPADLRVRFERLLGGDLGDVRVHTDSGAAAAAARLGAGAFTVGHNVFFAAGRFRPRSPDGLALLTHELIHVRQVSAGAPWGRHFSPPQERLLEQRARETAHQLAGEPPLGAPLPIASPPVSFPAERPLEAGWTPQAVNGAPPLILANRGRATIVTPLRQDASVLPPPPAPPPQGEAAARSDGEPPDLEAMGERLAGWLRRRERVERERSGVQRWR